MTVASGLNLFWLASVLVALGVLVFWERRRRARLRDRCRRAFAVFLAAVALFPCISASDDLVRFSALPGAEGARAAITLVRADSAHGRGVHLARLLQVLDSFRISAAAWLAITLVSCFLFIRLRSLDPESWAAATLIRGPPAPSIIFA